MAWNEIYNWLTQPASALYNAMNPARPSSTLTPGTEQKAANYFTQTSSPVMALLPKTTPYTQQLVSQYSPASDMGTIGSPSSSPGSYPVDPNAQISESMTDWQKEQARLAQERLDWEKYQYNNPQSQDISEYQRQQLAAQQQQSQQELAYQQQQLAAEQAWRTQQLEAEKQQRLATLAAQPKSWLEYASLANQAPVVQPWMLPLMPQDYMQSQPVGSPISGWTPENMKGMPDLINPSAQMRARMGPTALQQYYGYQQADQGMTPEESQFRLWSSGPPGGSYRGLTQQR